MARGRLRGRRLAALGMAVALGGAALLPGVVGAQAPPGITSAPTGQVVIACELPGFGAATAAGATAGVRIERGDLAAGLATALGKSQAEVERALEQAEREAPPPDTVAVVGVAGDAIGGQGLAPVAARLGVSAEDLLKAMKAATPPCPAEAPQGGATMGQRVDLIGFFEAIARELGRGITAAQVQAAFEAQRPPAGVQGSVAFSVTPAGHVEALARALGVSVEQVKAAFESIRPRPARG